MNDAPEELETTAPTDDPEIEAAIQSLPPEFYDQPEDNRTIDPALIHGEGNVMPAAQRNDMDSFLERGVA